MIDSTRSLHRALGVGSFVIVADQVTKQLASSAGLVILNKGISFGLLAAENPVFSFGLMIGLAVVIIVLIQAHWHKHPVSTGLFMGGAISNLVDRLTQGGVKDWLPIWPLPLKNNLADWAIFCAVVLVLWTLWKEDKKAVRSSKSSHRVQ